MRLKCTGGAAAAVDARRSGRTIPRRLLRDKRAESEDRHRVHARPGAVPRLRPIEETAVVGPAGTDREVGRGAEGARLQNGIDPPQTGVGTLLLRLLGAAPRDPVQPDVGTQNRAL